MKTLVLILSLAFILYSCKKEEKTETITTVVPPPPTHALNDAEKQLLGN
jgi:hypothetical protein